MSDQAPRDQEVRNRPIGVFDSGVGGLSVLRAIRDRLPHEGLLYCADSAFIPYGDRTTAEIRDRSFAITGQLLGLGAKALVVACNTATAAAIHELRGAHPHLPIIGMEPGLKPALDHSRSRKVGILATAGTLRSDKFRHLLERYGAGAEVVLQPCPGLVEQVERGALEHRETQALLRRYLEPLLAAEVDSVVLGCTHYPFLLPLIRRLVGDAITLVDTGPAVARQVERQLQHHGLHADPAGKGETRFYTTGDPAPLQPLFARLWGEPLGLEPLADLPPAAGAHAPIPSPPPGAQMNDPITPTERAAFRGLAASIDGIDTEVYRTFGKDPLEPIIGLGPRDARVGFFGRDPGRDEVQHGMPFIGAGGQKVRAALHHHLRGGELPDFQASIEIGRDLFWFNTVPYKPLGNKAWSMKVKKAFQPLMAGLLIDHWEGADLITLGREAFLWFAINQPRGVRDALEGFWGREDRFETVCETPLQLPDGRGRTFRLHPLPHPSPLNATWYKRFPGLLEARLAQLDLRPGRMRGED